MPRDPIGGVKKDREKNEKIRQGTILSPSSRTFSELTLISDGLSFVL
jgi:hypothetical protein